MDGVEVGSTIADIVISDLDDGRHCIHRFLPFFSTAAPKNTSEVFWGGFY